jgi:hypothetical protein
MIIGSGSFLIPRNHKLSMTDVMVGYQRASYRGRKPCMASFGKSSQILRVVVHDGYEWSGAAYSSVLYGGR